MKYIRKILKQISRDCLELLKYIDEKEMEEVNARQVIKSALFELNKNKK